MFHISYFFLIAVVYLEAKCSCCCIIAVEITKANRWYNTLWQEAKQCFRVRERDSKRISCWNVDIFLWTFVFPSLCLSIIRVSKDRNWAREYRHSPEIGDTNEANWSVPDVLQLLLLLGKFLLVIAGNCRNKSRYCTNWQGY